MIDKIVDFFKGIWWVIKTIGIAIFKVICFVVGLLIKYFPIYLPVLILAGYVILWLTGTMLKLDSTIYGLWDFIGYEYELTVGLAHWLTSTEHNFFSAITLGLVQVVLIAVVAVLETIIVYVLFFGVGSIIIMAIQFVLWMIFLIGIPVAAPIYSFIMIKNSCKYNIWFYILSFVLTLAMTVIHFIYLIPAFAGGA
jgi:hypothetical protein